MNIGPVVTLFYKQQIEHTEPQIIDGKERSSRCIHCQSVIVFWAKAKTDRTNPNFQAHFVTKYIVFALKFLTKNLNF